MNEEQIEKILAVMEPLRGMDFSVKEPEYRAQIMKAVNDYADTRVREAVLQVLNDVYHAWAIDSNPANPIMRDKILEIRAQYTSPERTGE